MSGGIIPTVKAHDTSAGVGLPVETYRIQPTDTNPNLSITSPEGCTIWRKKDMSNPVKNNQILKVGKTVSKILEIICWIGVAALLFTAVAGIVNPEWMTQKLISDSGISMNGIEMELNENASLASVVIILLGGVAGFIVLAILFHNLHKVLSTADEGVCFRAENITRIERIGWLSITMPVIGFVTSVLAKLFGGPDALEISIDLTGVVMGILVLCLSQFFAHGVKLENDVDGLV